MITEVGEELEDGVRERHWHMVFEEKNGRVDGKKALHHAKRCDV